MTQLGDIEQKRRIEQLRAELQTPLPRSQMVLASDIARLAHVDINTIYVWTSRKILHPHRGLYDWREAVLWLMTRNLDKITEPTATRAAV